MGGQDGNANWRIDGYDDNPGVFLIPVKSYIYATMYLWIAIILEVLKTIFCNKNFKINATDRVGLTRSAILLILFLIFIALGFVYISFPAYVLAFGRDIMCAKSTVQNHRDESLNTE